MAKDKLTAAQERMQHELDKVAVLDPKEDATQTLKRMLKQLAGVGLKATPEEIAQEVVKRLLPESKEMLLTDLIAREAEKRGFKSKSALEHMYDLAPDVDKGQYPYVNAYDAEIYEEKLYGLQIELLKLQKWVRETNQKVIIIFEGRDAAGKGGTIATFVDKLNPRGARIVALPKPTDAERGQWYFQRYVRQLPSPGEIVLFDRSWYNRAVVEPVMGFCTPEQTQQFLREVLFFEKSLVESGIHLVKIWLDVSRKEQKRRFKVRRTDPLRRWKLSPVDIASLDMWDEYTEAIRQMFLQTDAPYAPWTVIRSDDKRRARIQVIRRFLSDIPYAEKNPELLSNIDGRIVLSVPEYLRLPAH